MTQYRLVSCSRGKLRNFSELSDRARKTSLERIFITGMFDMAAGIDGVVDLSMESMGIVISQ